ncbi:MAG: exodeoxyribonuclease VII large subunit [Oscillospiraceae bacterium]|nr:exodeoxyribonuclease VII large subunit [Oscillospiraceae bacterium]
MEQTVFTVGQVNQYLKAKLDSDRLLASIAIRGEISNYKRYPSGHHYFSLKDADGAIKAVLFRSSAQRLRFQPENGMKVVARGRITVFPRDGQYQLYAESLIPDGVGELYVAFEQTKERLFKEGLFAQEHKKPIPAYPETIALITSSAGAAVHDMIRILKARWPIAEVRLLPVRVQGAQAPAELCGALRYANAHKLADVIIIGRGGGSMEDLWAFNDEKLARTIFASEIPVISAVGHEPDVTISDFVADLRAATPSNAAELAVPDWRELEHRLGQLSRRMEGALSARLENERRKLKRLAESRAMTDPENYIRDKRVLVDWQQGRLVSAMEKVAARSRSRLAALAAGLDAMSPLKVLARGYSLAFDEDNKLMRSVESVQPGQNVALRLSNGSLDCTVMKVRKEG